MNFIGKFLGNIYKAIASKGKYQSLCDCDNYEVWNSEKYYYTDDLVVYNDKLYVALATPPINQSLSAEPVKHRNDKNDVPMSQFTKNFYVSVKIFQLLLLY